MIKVIEINLEWPQSISILELRDFIVNELNMYGNPLRWAITFSKPPKFKLEPGYLKIEAVVITT